jgi:formamidopyrimidine-DNA glycosylase
MPELPEVETVRRSLLPLIVGQKPRRIEIFNESVVACGDLADLLGLEIMDIGRRGKYLIIYFEKELTLVVHLRMTGRLLWREQPLPLPKHSHVVFRMEQGGELVFADVRRFGRLWLVPQSGLKEISGLCKLALEPLDEGFSSENLQQNLQRHKKAPIKAVLLDQTVVAGLGNIYVDEVLFAAKLNPMRLTGNLTESEIAVLAEVMPQILAYAIEKRGTTFRDYVDGNNQSGTYQDFLKVFHKEGEKCSVCGTVILKTKVGGRSTFYCPNCQPK